MDNSLHKKEEAPNIQDNPQNADKIERYKQQLEGSKAEALKKAEEANRYKEMLINIEYEKVTKDKNYLSDLHKKDPVIADEIAKKFSTSTGTPISSYEEYTNVFAEGNNTDAISNFNPETISKMLDDKMQEYIAMQNNQKVSETVNKMFDGMNGEKRDMAKKFYEDLTSGKNLTTEEAMKYAEMTTLYVNKEEIQQGATNNFIATMGASSIGGHSGVNTTSKQVENPLVAKLGFNHLDSNK